MRSIGKIRQIVEETTGLGISHIFDDLVFIENSVILLRFDDGNFQNFFLYFNQDCQAEDEKNLLTAFEASSKRNHMSCTRAGHFSLEEVPEKEEVRITFHP